MILEFLNYAATHLLTGAASRPFIRSSVNLWSRANRCAKAWAAHEAATQSAIRAAMAGLKQRRTVVVLGSGLLRDVPIADLARNFDHVVLIDLVHLASVRLRLKARRYRNVRLVERDLSGYDALRAGGAAEPLAFLRQVPYLDLVVSANLLSQIGTGAKKRMEADRGPSAPADALPKLITAHLEGLKQLGCAHCLITDISFRVIDRTGKLHQDMDLLYGVPPPPHAANWDWPVIPLGEDSKDYQVVHRVIAASDRDLL